MSFETIIYGKNNGVAKITLNRPEVRNAENRQMSKEVLEAFKLAEEDNEVIVVVLAAAGTSFSSGHDLGSEAAKEENKREPVNPTMGRYEHEEERWFKSWMHVRDMDKPTIASVQGYCIMGGFMLATMCDLIVAADDARFADMAVRMGGAAVEYFSHPWELGIRKCKEFLFTGDYIDAQEAYRLGMVNKVVPREKLEEETMNLANKIALQKPHALKLAKQAVNYTQDLMGFRESLRFLFNIHQLTHAYREIDPSMSVMARNKSVKEFLADRDSKFKGK